MLLYFYSVSYAVQDPDKWKPQVDIFKYLNYMAGHLATQQLT